MEQTGHLGCLAQQVAVVGGERLGAVEEQADAGLADDGHAVHRGLHERGDVLVVLGQRGEAELVGDAAHAPRLRHRLEPPDEQLAGVFLEVAAPVLVAQHRHRRRDALDALGDDVEVLGGVQRHGGADACAEFVAPHACAVHDHVGADVAAVGAHAHCTTVLDDDLVDARVLEDLRPTRASTLGERLGGVDRVGDAVARQVHGADEIVHVGERHEVLHVGGSDDVHLEAEHAGHRRLALEFLEALLVRGDAHRTALLEPGGLTGLLLERGEQVGGVLREAGEVLRGAQLADEAGGVPGGAARELLALEHDDVGDAAQGEVVGDAASDDAAAHDDDSSAAGQVGHGNPSGVSRPGANRL